MGAPGLTMFGAGDAQRQVIYGMTDNYGAMRDPSVNDSPMPQDLEASYLKLNLPGSPLPMNGLSSTQNLIASLLPGVHKISRMTKTCSLRSKFQGCRSQSLCL